jgi:hypothetical protein
MSGLTLEERVVIRRLAGAWNAFLNLPVEHDDDVEEFRRAIHAANAKVMMRPGRREYNDSPQPPRPNYG